MNAGNTNDPLWIIHNVYTDIDQVQVHFLKANITHQS